MRSMPRARLDHAVIEGPVGNVTDRSRPNKVQAASHRGKPCSRHPHEFYGSWSWLCLHGPTPLLSGQEGSNSLESELLQYLLIKYSEKAASMGQGCRGTRSDLLLKAVPRLLRANPEFPGSLYRMPLMHGFRIWQKSRAGYSRLEPAICVAESKRRKVTGGLSQDQKAKPESSLSVPTCYVFRACF